jgi:hypothetical protein
VDPSMIMAAYNGLKFAKDSLTTLADGKIERESQARILEALGKLGSAQDALFELRDELFSLQTENARLKGEIDLHNQWAQRLAQYELTQTAGGAVVYRFKSAPEHYACPSCVNLQKLEILQDTRTMFGLYICTGCDKRFPIKPKEKPAPISYPQGDWT